MTKRTYSTPAVEVLGSVRDLTAVYGAPATYDTFINENGDIIGDPGQQSLDLCVSNNDDPNCLANG